MREIIVNKLAMVSMVVSDMKKAKEFYAEKLGLEVATDYRQNDDNWWVTFTFPGGGASVTLARSSQTNNEPRAELPEETYGNNYY